MSSLPRPRRCMVTRTGAVLLAGAAVAFLVTMICQRVSTGSFSRGAGFVAPLPIKMVVLYGTPASLVVLLIGAVVDSARYSAWKRRGGSGERR